MLQPGQPDMRPLLVLKDRVVENFLEEHWLEVGVATNGVDIVRNHPRLLRGLSYGNPDYPGAVLDVLLLLVGRDPRNLATIEAYLSAKFVTGENVSTTPGPGRQIVFTPSVFNVPDGCVDDKQVAVLMPFGAGFAGVYDAIGQACTVAGLNCRRADDMWEHSEVIQDIFSLIFRANIVIADFTDRNPNVFYEVGIAHTLGKQVVPITQSKLDVPFDVQHHRYLTYLNNTEGRIALANGLTTRLQQLTAPAPFRF